MMSESLLPRDDSALVGMRTMMALFDASRMAVWRRVRAGVFPKPRKFFGRNYWLVAEVRAVQAAIERGELAGERPPPKRPRRIPKPARRRT